MSTDPVSYELPPLSPHTNEGKTVAGWTLMWGSTLGAAFVAFSVIFWLQWALIVGVIIIVVSLVLSQVMRAMGMGQPRKRADDARRADGFYT